MNAAIIFPSDQISCNTGHLVLLQFRRRFSLGSGLIQEILREYHRLNKMLSRRDDGQREKDSVIKQEQRDEEGEE